MRQARTLLFKTVFCSEIVLIYSYYPFKKIFIYLTASGLLIVAALGIFLASCDIFRCWRMNSLVAEGRLSSSEACGILAPD